MCMKSNNVATFIPPLCASFIIDFKSNTGILEIQVLKEGID